MILSKLDYPLLPKSYQVFEADGCLYIVMEFVKGQGLENLLKKNGKIPEAASLKWFQQICDVWVYLHGLDVSIVYRDLKPSNIMMQPSGDVKLLISELHRSTGKREKRTKKCWR